MSTSTKLSAPTFSYRTVAAVYIPLAAMWIMMGVEQPGLNAVIARLPAAELQLAAFGVTFSLALIVESPVLQMLAAATALTTGRGNYRRLTNFMHVLAGALTVIHTLLALPPVYRFLIEKSAGIPHELIEPSRLAFTVMIPWAAAVGYRRLWQGILIKYGKAKVVPVTMITRLVVTALGLGTGLFLRSIPGALVAAGSVILGVIAGAVSSYLFARPVIRREFHSRPGAAEAGYADKKQDEQEMSTRALLSFYVPLALTSVIVLGARPLLTFGIAQAPMATRSLAVWPVIIAFTFLFQSLALALQEAVIALYRREEDLVVIKRFSYALAGLLLLTFWLVVLTPVWRLWFGGVAGLTPRLIEMVHLPLAIVTLFPTFFVFVSLYRGILVKRRHTRTITRAVMLNSTTLAVVMFGGAFLLPVAGAVTAAIAFSLSIFLEVLYLHYYSTY